MSASFSRLRFATAALLAAGALSAGLVQPGAAHAAACANQSTPLGTTAAAEDGIVCLTNQVRAGAGLPRVFVSTRLASIARHHSEDMAKRDYFSHVTPEGIDLFGRLARSNYCPCPFRGENLAHGKGRPTPAMIMTVWMNSAVHRANILNPNFREIGVGVAIGTPTADGGGTYTMDLGTRA